MSCSLFLFSFTVHGTVSFEQEADLQLACECMCNTFRLLGANEPSICLWRWRSPRFVSTVPQPCDKDLLKLLALIYRQKHYSFVWSVILLLYRMDCSETKHSQTFVLMWKLQNLVPFLFCHQL